MSVTTPPVRVMMFACLVATTTLWAGIAVAQGNGTAAASPADESAAIGPPTVDPTPPGPSEAGTTHALTPPLGTAAAVVETSFDSVLVDHSTAQPSADVPNVGVRDVDRIGIDRGKDDPGSRVDVRAASVASVGAERDGTADTTDATTTGTDTAAEPETPTAGDGSPGETTTGEGADERRLPVGFVTIAGIILLVITLAVNRLRNRRQS